MTIDRIQSHHYFNNPVEEAMKRLGWLLLALVLAPALSRADGIIVPPPGVNISVKYHHVTVDINDNVAITTIDQVFLNDTEIDSIEGIYIFPLPKGAAISNFTMFIDGEEISGQMLPADSARAIYESIVRRRLDPALLEYLGTGLFRARVFPIRAKAEKRIKISYSQMLRYDSGIYAYRYSLNTLKFSARPLDSVSVAASISSSSPIKTVYSPSHPIRVERPDETHANVLYAESGVKPDTDFQLYYTVSIEDVGLHVLTHRPVGEDGFYLFLAAPKVEIDDAMVVKKRILFVLDRSGSMAGKKIRQAKEALRYVVNQLNEQDQFNIIAFSSGLRSFQDQPVPATPENQQAAEAFISRFSADGGTNINDALLAAMGQMKQDEFTNMIMFLTDGRPTVGERDIDAIRNNVKKANQYGARLFVFGVGYDVNTHLLDYLSEDNAGLSIYVHPEEDIEVAVSSFFSKINYPVLANLKLDYGGLRVYDVYPQELPDLFRGLQITVLGRYESSGSYSLTLTGDVNGQQRQFQTEALFPEESDQNAFIPRLWALRKIGHLLNQIRLYGESEELINEIIKLSKRYGIVTPYTSILILENAPGGRSLSDLRQQTGYKAFSAASDIGAYRSAVTTRNLSVSEVRYVAGKTFFLRDSFWVDVQFTGNERIVDVLFASDAYFQLLAQQPALGKYFSLGKNVIVRMDDVAYKVHEPDRDYTIIPGGYLLFQNAPNPFRSGSGTAIRYMLTTDSRVKLAVYDILGREVIVLDEGYRPAGEHQILWYGYDRYGQPLANGMYFFRLQTEHGAAVKKMIIVR